MLIALPKGAGLSGITSWAANLSPALARRGHRVMVLVHATREAPTLGPLEGLALGGAEGRVACRLLRGCPAIDDEVPEPRPELPAYVEAVSELSGESKAPVIGLASHAVRVFGLMAAASRAVMGKKESGVLRTIGYVHNDIPYDVWTLRHYERLLHRLVGVSSEITTALARAVPGRAGDVVRLPYGVSVPEWGPERVPEWTAVRTALGGRPLRLVYTGRMYREQKRVDALIDMSRELARRGVWHELTLVGDGPMSQEIDALAAESRGRVRRVSVEPAGVSAWLERSDILVMASRYEGLSVSMLEAMAHGCVPVVTRVSGVADAVENAVAGSCCVVVSAGPSVDEPGLGALLAEGVMEAVETGLPALGARAASRARRSYSVDVMADAVSAMCRDVAREPARVWGDGPTDPGDFTVPVDATERVRRALEERAPGARVALWGAGRHTRRVLEDAPELRSGERVALILDDQAGPEGGELFGIRVVAPARASEFGVTDVVISSAMHEDALWVRRGELERFGARVHRLYATSAAHENAPAR